SVGGGRLWRGRHAHGVVEAQVNPKREHLSTTTTPEPKAFLVSDPNMADLIIGWCGTEAAPVVHALTQAAFAPQVTLEPPSGATRETLEVVEDDLARGRAVVASLTGRTVAAARVLFSDGRLHLRRVAVHPDFQRRGIARALMTWVHAEAARLGCFEVRLGVRKALGSTRRFYENLGYELASDEGFWVWLALDLSDTPEVFDPDLGAR
ncbi:MAG: GNAT family N-acetyltransferase, partial [Acidimicrobiales bacterium]